MIRPGTDRPAVCRQMRACGRSAPDAVVPALKHAGYRFSREFALSSLCVHPGG